MSDRGTAEKLIYEVIRPTLKAIGHWSAAAERLLFVIAAHESGGFEHRKQVGGPALSLWQIEPQSFHSFCANNLAFRPARCALLRHFLHRDYHHLAAITEDVTFAEWTGSAGALTLLKHLERDDHFACAFARLMLVSVPEPLPDVTDLDGLAAYAKQHWNTESGKASVGKYRHDGQLYSPYVLPPEWRA